MFSQHSIIFATEKSTKPGGNHNERGGNREAGSSDPSIPLPERSIVCVKYLAQYENNGQGSKSDPDFIALTTRPPRC